MAFVLWWIRTSCSKHSATSWIELNQHQPSIQLHPAGFRLTPDQLNQITSILNEKIQYIREKIISRIPHTKLRIHDLMIYIIAIFDCFPSFSSSATRNWLVYSEVNRPSPSLWTSTLIHHLRLGKTTG
ncbi:hypothetical protein DSUL_30106 [Desulfovibrionales bacterium]